MDIFFRVFSYCRRYPFFAVSTLFCAVTSTIMGLVYPSLAGKIIDAISVGHAEYLGWMILGLVVAFVLRDGFNSLRLRLNNTFEQKVIFDLRHELYSTIQRFPLPWFDQSSTGDLMTKVSEDVVNVERMLIDGIEQGVVALLQVLVVGIALFHLNTHLAWWALLPIPFLFAGALWYTLTAHKRYSLIRRATSDMNSLLLDNLQGVRQIKSYVREERELHHFAQKANDVRNATLVVMKAWAWYSPAMALFASLGAVPVLYFGGKEVLAGGGLRIGELVSFLLYVGMFYEPIGRLHQLNQLMQSGRAAGKRVFKLLDTECEYEPSSSKPLPVRRDSGRQIEFRHVSFSYREGLPVLHDISIHVKPGMTIALVGSTGAGKTTLVNMVPRFYKYSEGDILIDGVSVNDLTARELRDEIGVVSQESFLFNDTIRNNLLFGKPDASDEELRAALEAANASVFVDKLPDKIDTHVGERGVKLSVGEKQRISIARALLKDPPILILDEATASVDTATELLIQQALDRLLSHRTSFVIAHRLSTVRNADMICVMEKGRIIERGTHEELMQLGGLYNKLCTVQNPYNTIEETLSHIG